MLLDDGDLCQQVGSQWKFHYEVLQLAVMNCVNLQGSAAKPAKQCHLQETCYSKNSGSCSCKVAAKLGHHIGK